MNATDPLLDVSDAILMMAWKNIENFNLLNTETRTWVCHTLADFCYRAVDKYVRGQLEHGGSIMDRDCLRDAQAEIIDLLFYISAERQKQIQRKERNHP